MSQGKVLFNLYLKALDAHLRTFQTQMTRLTAHEFKFCKTGCSNCCYGTFFVNQAEAMWVAVWLEKDPERRETFLSRRRERQATLREHDDLFRRCAGSGAEAAEAALEFQNLKIPCAFLNPDGFCMIYPVRPMVCSTYISITPSRFCLSDPKSVVTAPMNQLFSQTRAALERGAQKYKQPSGLLLDISEQVALVLEGMGSLEG